MVGRLGAEELTGTKAHIELLPAIDILDGNVVRLAQGDYDRVTVYHDNPVDMARELAQAGARWIHVVDLNGARDGAPANLSVLEEIASLGELKIEVGGGVRSEETVKRLLDAGVTRCILGTKLVTDPELTRSLCATYGGGIVAGVDARDGEVSIEGWRQGSGVSAEVLVGELRQWGVAHLVYTDIARDGMQIGINAPAYQRVAETAGFPVIASGGVSTLEDIRELNKLGPSVIEGVIVGRALYENAFTVEEALAELHRTGEEG